MKKFIAGLLTGIMIMSTIAVFAESLQTIQVIFDRVKLVVDGKALHNETLLYDGTTYIPLRAAAEALGVDVGWDGNTHTASLTSKGISTPVAPPSPTASVVSPTPTTITTQKTEELELVDFGYSISSAHNSYLHYSIILRNPNDIMVRFPSYKITAYSKEGKILGTSDNVRGYIYPNDILVFAGLAFSIDEVPERVEVEVQPIKENDKISIFEPYETLKIEGASENSKGNILGQVVNPNNKTYDSVFVVVAYRDKSGKLLGGNFTYVNNLPANGKTAFDIMGNDFDGAYSFEVYAHHE